METLEKTPFSVVYNAFLARVTDEMYMEMTELDTFRILQDLLISAIPKFEFPRVNIHENYEESYVEDESPYCGVESDHKPATAYIYSGGCFYCALTREEINILAVYMIVEWFGQQIASTENTRMKYSGDDFKFTSQANHLSKLLQMKKDYEREGFHLQRLYKRRKINKDGIMVSTLGTIMETTD